MRDSYRYRQRGWPTPPVRHGEDELDVIDELVQQAEEKRIGAIAADRTSQVLKIKAELLAAKSAIDPEANRYGRGAVRDAIIVALRNIGRPSRIRELCAISGLGRERINSSMCSMIRIGLARRVRRATYELVTK